MGKAYIKNISYHLPENKFSNEDFFELFPEEISRTSLNQLGIEVRHVVEDGTTASDLAVLAAENLFKEHSIDRREVDFILFCAQEFDYYTPTTACVIQERLGLEESCGALDFNLGCSGFVYGLSLAKGLIETGAANQVLLLTSSTLTKTFHSNDRSSRFVFGDGAAATLLSSRATEGIGNFEFGTSGKGKEKIIVEHGGARNPINSDSFIERKDDYGNVTAPGNFFMDGTGIFLFANRKVPQLVEDTLAKNQIALNEIDLVVFHQANEFLLETLRKKIDIPEDKFYIYMSDTGNTVSSTIPIALYHAIEDGKAKPGDNVLFVAFGVGLSWAGTVVQL